MVIITVLFCTSKGKYLYLIMIIITVFWCVFCVAFRANAFTSSWSSKFFFSPLLSEANTFTSSWSLSLCFSALPRANTSPHHGHHHSVFVVVVVWCFQRQVPSPYHGHQQSGFLCFQRQISSAEEPITPPPNYDAALHILAQSQENIFVSKEAATPSPVLRRALSVENIGISRGRPMTFSSFGANAKSFGNASRENRTWDLCWSNLCVLGSGGGWERVGEGWYVFVCVCFKKWERKRNLTTHRPVSADEKWIWWFNFTCMWVKVISRLCSVLHTCDILL